MPISTKPGEENRSRHGLPAPAAAGMHAARPRIGAYPFARRDAIFALEDDNAPHALLALRCRSRIDSLPPRQRDVLAGLMAGHRNKQIAHMLGLSPRTIEMHRASMMDRLKARTLAQALHIAFLAGFAPGESLSPGTD